MAELGTCRRHGRSSPCRECAEAYEPTVDTEAAEVWRGLSEAQRRDILDLCEDDMPRRLRCWRGLRRNRRGLRRNQPLIKLAPASGHHPNSWVLTDLGKRVAAYGRSQAKDGAK